MKMPKEVFRISKNMLSEAAKSRFHAGRSCHTDVEKTVQHLQMTDMTGAKRLFHSAKGAFLYAGTMSSGMPEEDGLTGATD